MIVQAGEVPPLARHVVSVRAQKQAARSGRHASIVSRSGQDTSNIVIIGVGNDSRRDDGAGLVFVRELRSHLGEGNGARFVESDGDPAKLLEHWTGAALAIVVDASSSGAAPGTVTELDAAKGSNGHGLRHSTHAMGVLEAVELGRALGRMPSRLRIIAIEGSDFSHGEGLTPGVREAVAALVRRVVGEMRNAKCEMTNDKLKTKN